MSLSWLTSLIISLIVAYLLGSFSFAILIAKLYKASDPRKTGSQNPGATNILRIAGKRAAAFTLLGDVIKGFVAVIIGKLLGVGSDLLGWVALAAVVGHIFPIYFSFQGGKGVATTLGVMLAVTPIVAFALIVTWLVIAFISKYSSLASIITMIALPIYLLIAGKFYYILPAILMAIVVILKHRENMSRLRQGIEKKIKF